MNIRTLKIILAVSVALNLFAVVAGVSLWVGLSKEQDRIEAQHRSPRSGSMMMLISELDPEVRGRARDVLRASALAARPDFEEARQKRREAVNLAGSAGLDVDRIGTLLAESREAEMRGRARLEADAVALLATLEPEDRKAMSQILTRRGRTVVRHQPDPATRTERPVPTH